MNLSEPTSYPEINQLLHEVLAGAQQILGNHFVGMYLEGSLTSDDFDRYSDVDFAVVSDEDISSEQFEALRLMHDRIMTFDSWYADELEGSYISQQALRRHDPAHALHPNIERGPTERLKWAYHDTAWQVHRWILRERGITLVGPAPQTLIDPVAPEDLKQAMREPLEGWAQSILDAPVHIQSRGYQSYVVLTLCRILYTLHTSTVATKRVAARWALDALDPRWTPLIERAWEGRHSAEAERAASGAGWSPLVGGTQENPRPPEALPDDMEETLAFIRYTIERGGQM